VDELSFYSLGRDQLAVKVGLSGPKATAFIRFLDLKNDPECFKRFAVGKTKFDRYSSKAINVLQEAISKHDVAKIWKSHGTR
jgi:hypothetical protein